MYGLDGVLFYWMALNWVIWFSAKFYWCEILPQRFFKWTFVHFREQKKRASSIRQGKATVQLKNLEAIVKRDGNPYHTCAVPEGCPNKLRRKRLSLAPTLIVDCGYRAAIKRRRDNWSGNVRRRCKCCWWEGNVPFKSIAFHSPTKHSNGFQQSVF